LSSESGSEHAGHDKPTQESLVLAAVGYVPLLFFVPISAARDDEFAGFHGRQSMVLQLVLFVFWTGVWVIDFLLGRVLGNMLILGFIFKAVAWIIHYPVGLIVSGSYVVLAIVGIIHALSGRRWSAPFVKRYAGRLVFKSETTP
jgi:uncharacterized membrane protein